MEDLDHQVGGGNRLSVRHAVCMYLYLVCIYYAVCGSFSLLCLLHNFSELRIPLFRMEMYRNDVLVVPKNTENTK